MPASLRDLKRRRRAVQSMKKITRAMELIAASKVSKAQQRMIAARPYARGITAAISELVSTEREIKHPYLEQRSSRRSAAVIVVTADRGLAGAFSANTLRAAEDLISDLGADDVDAKLLVVGRKAVSYFKYRNRPTVQTWAGFSDAPTYAHAKEVAAIALQMFKDESVDEIYIVFAEFVSFLSQRPEVRRLLPLVIEDEQDVDGDGIVDAHQIYCFEPAASTVLDALLPRYIEARVYAAFLESTAAEFAARRNAMSAATKNASELIGVYTRQYNQARQAGITSELMDVVNAASAFSDTGSGD